MSRTTLVAALVSTALVGGAYGVGSAYASHRDADGGAPATAERAAPGQDSDPDATEDSGTTPHPDRRRERPAPEEPQVTLRPAPAPVLLAVGDDGPRVRELQARLRQIDWFSGDVTDHYGEQTRAAVAGFQVKRGLPETGSLDTDTLARLEAMTTEPTAEELANTEPEVVPDAADGAPLDPRCLTGRVICVDKTSSSLRWVVDGEVRLTVDARFGGNGYTTREGEFSVYRMSRDHVSSLYDTSMPFAMFFSGGQAVHYSPDFAAVGYAGASHGCVNVRDFDSVAWLYDQVQVGDKVVVSWS